MDIVNHLCWTFTVKNNGYLWDKFTCQKSSILCGRYVDLLIKKLFWLTYLVNPLGMGKVKCMATYQRRRRGRIATMLVVVVVVIATSSSSSSVGVAAAVLLFCFVCFFFCHSYGLWSRLKWFDTFQTDNGLPLKDKWL